MSKASNRFIERKPRVSRQDAGFSCYAELAATRAEGLDFSVHVERRPESAIAVLAPHGGAIEAGTSEVARAVAKFDFNLYLFEGICDSGNYAALHLTSHRFDEPRCLTLVSECDYVVTIHGCRGNTPRVFLGGLDDRLKHMIYEAVLAAGIDARLGGHPFPAVEPKNICNRGRNAAGVQLELTSALRLPDVNKALARAVRSVLLGLNIPVSGEGSG